MRNNPTNPLVFLALLAAGAGIAGAQSENRSSMTLNESGQVLRFVAENDNEPTAVIESGGGSTDILAFGDALAGGEVWGFGNIADLNNSGVAVMKVVTVDDVDAIEDRGAGAGLEDNVLITSTGGAPNVIAVARGDGTGTAFGSDTLCQIGPMPEINGAGQVSYFGNLDIGGQGVNGRRCEDADDLYPTGFDSGESTTFGGGDTTFAWSQSFVDNNDPSPTELVYDPGTDTVSVVGVTGQTVLKSAIIRWSSGVGNEVLLTGREDLGAGADTIVVSNPDFVSTPTQFTVANVDIIRDADDKLTAGGLVGGYALLDTEAPAFGAEPDPVMCSEAPNVTQTNDNPFDDPDGSDPFIRYTFDPNECPETSYTAFDQLPRFREAIVALGDGAPEVIAMTGEPGESIYQAFDYQEARGSQGHFVMNDAGQFLFKATVGVEPDDRGSNLYPCGVHYGRCEVTEYRLELYSPSVGISTIVKTGDPVPTPGSDAAFCDFAPHYDMANDGSFAFLATLAGDGTCEFQEGTNGAIDTNGGNRGVDDDAHDGLFYYSNGVITELFRTQQAADADTGTGPFISSWSGNDIDEIGSVAVVEAPGLVQFFVENADYVPTACEEPRGSDSDFGGGEWTAMMSWTPESGLESIMEEGDLLGTDGDDYIFRIHTVGPKLRSQGNANAELVALLEIDRDGDCDVDEDDQNEPGGDQVIVVGRGTPPIGSVLEIPVTGALGLGIFSSALLLLSLMWVRSRAAGA